MKLVLAIINNDDRNAVIDEGTAAGYSVTRLSSSGGFLRAGNTTLIFVVEEERVEDLISLIGKHSKRREQLVSAVAPQYGEGFISPVPVSVTVGGATIFVVDVEQFRQL